jgi:protein-tyrosine phosphatase
MNTRTELLNRLSDFWETFRNQPGKLPCYWQTDLHSHLLPGVDDGVSTHEEVLVCLRQLADWGIRHIVTTPHINKAWYPNDRATLLAGQAALRKMIAHYELPLTIEVAAEYMLDELFLDLLVTGELLSFGEARYLLVELDPHVPPPQLEMLLFQIQAKGYRPVLAHPERYRYYHENLDALGRLHDLGCLFQVNWGSCIGRYGRPVKVQAGRILKKQWADFIGSDLHRPEDLPGLQTFFDSAAYRLLPKQPLLNAEL